MRNRRASFFRIAPFRLAFRLPVSNRHLLWGLVAAFAVLLGIAAGAVLLKPPATALKTGTLLSTPKVIGSFALQGADGTPLTEADLRGHWTLMFAGYTYCPDVCPTTLLELKVLATKLGADAAQLQVLFVSVDPARDTPQKLASYVHYFDPAFRAATADDATLEEFGRRVGFVFTKVPGGTPDAYLMDHSASLILIDPEARVAGYFSPPFQTDAMAADLRPLLKTHG